MAKTFYGAEGIRLTRLEESELGEVLVTGPTGLYLGGVWKAWFRLGGASWTHTLSMGGGFPTRWEAVRDLVRKRKLQWPMAFTTERRG